MRRSDFDKGPKKWVGYELLPDLLTGDFAAPRRLKRRGAVRRVRLKAKS